MSRGRKLIPPPPHFLSGYPVHKAGKSLYPQVALVLPSRSDGNGVPRYVLHQLVAVGILCSQIFFAKRHRHSEMDFVGVNALFRLTDNDFMADTACEVERGQAGVYLLFCKCVGFAVEIDKSQRVLQIAESCLQTPA